jgi:hypothetical protein
MQTKYQVKPKETYSTLAAKMGVPPSQLIAANPGVPRLSTGLTIKVPRSLQGIYGSAGGVQSTPDYLANVLSGNYASDASTHPGAVAGNATDLGAFPVNAAGASYMHNRQPVDGTSVPNAFSPRQPMPSQTIFGPGGSNPLGASGQAGALKAGPFVPSQTNRPAPGSGITPTDFQLPISDSNGFAPQRGNGLGLGFQTPPTGTGSGLQPATSYGGSFSSANGTVNQQPGLPGAGNANPQASANDAWVKYWNGQGARPTDGSVYNPSGAAPDNKFYAGGTNQKFNSLRDARQYQMSKRRQNQAYDASQAPIAAPVVSAPVGNDINVALNWRM